MKRIMLSVSDEMFEWLQEEKRLDHFSTEQEVIRKLVSDELIRRNLKDKNDIHLMETNLIMRKLKEIECKE